MTGYIDCASWVPIDAMEAYLDSARHAEDDDTRSCLKRLVTRSEMAGFYSKFEAAFGYMDWATLFSACCEAMRIQYHVLHHAPEVADKRLRAIASLAGNLSTALENYREGCLNGRVDCAPSVLRFFDPVDPRNCESWRLIDGLSQVAMEAMQHEHVRYGIGRKSYESRIQATKDLLPQFVRYLIPRLEKSHSARELAMPMLTSSDVARLAIASLNIRATGDDYLGKIEGRIKKLRG